VARAPAGPPVEPPLARKYIVSYIVSRVLLECVLADSLTSHPVLPLMKLRPPLGLTRAPPTPHFSSVRQPCGMAPPSSFGRASCRASSVCSCIVP